MLQMAYFDRASPAGDHGVSARYWLLRTWSAGRCGALASRAAVPRDYLDTAAALERYNRGRADRLRPAGWIRALTYQDFADAARRLDQGGRTGGSPPSDLTGPERRRAEGAVRGLAPQLSPAPLTGLVRLSHLHPVTLTQ